VNQTHKRETVVVVHGLWLTGSWMRLLAWRLRRCGFDVRIFSWATVRQTMSHNAERLQHFARSLDADTIHFVGYSLGGVLIRALFHYYPEQQPGRVVTIASPHGGSRVAEALARFGLGRRILGKSVQQLLAGLPQQWPLPAREIGTISGDMPVGLGRLFFVLRPPNDGLLIVEETQLVGATHSIVLPVAHTGMMFSSKAAAQVCQFLRQGHFDHLVATDQASSDA
jgi:pimeloyl-ACP methyl ester carboxylesterase